MPVEQQQMPQEPAPTAAAVALPTPESRISSEQPRPTEPMKADDSMRLRGGGDGEVSLFPFDLHPPPAPTAPRKRNARTQTTERRKPLFVATRCKKERQLTVFL
ncbi:hypothetical protein JDV02_007336 [Purpureocillium takamizusanense]|uniref:Uncharacterized protein n=1 Tax=Purpureocillium takamizusanense TaxID=2060973 RepID=A0A9Q8QMU3_9HYPO|nr:uncharacterized protein JDV02_007336 [Purpureocillium takamizusanense]UNI21337.1 hypothetical protein JDV02_007336 [Purpureocillium takamizusanense]